MKYPKTEAPKIIRDNLGTVLCVLGQETTILGAQESLVIN